MILSEIGKIVFEEWKKSEIIRKHIYLDEWIVMPDHIHGIVGIDYGDSGRDVLSKRLDKGSNSKMSEISPVSNSLSVMIRFFKRAVTIRARAIQSSFEWQSSFHDHIIRDVRSLYRIRKYIVLNVESWKR